MSLRNRNGWDGSVGVREQPVPVEFACRADKGRMGHCRPEGLFGCRIDRYIEVMALEVHPGSIAVNIKRLFVRRREGHKFVCRLKSPTDVLIEGTKRAAIIRISRRRGASECIIRIAIAEIVAIPCTTDVQIQDSVSGEEGQYITDSAHDRVRRVAIHGV